jgi:hypothetical protein
LKVTNVTCTARSNSSYPLVGSKEAVAALREKVVWLDFLTGTTLVIPGQIRDEVDWRKTDVSTIPCG